MDYFSVTVLIIVTFIFISDRSVKNIDRIKKEKGNIDIYTEMENIKTKLEIRKINTNDMNYNNILKQVQASKSEYIILQNDELNLNSSQLDTFIANYIDNNKKTCAFNLLYVYKGKKWSLKKIYIDIINYLNIFNKNDLTTYGLIICTKYDFLQSEKKFKKSLTSYTPVESTHVEFTREEIKIANLKRIYIDKLTKANIDIIVRLVLLIISGSVITTNLIYSILNVNNNINGLIISCVIYYCYSYIIRYIYKPIGKHKIVATYIFPIYFISYIIVSIYTLAAKVIKKVHAS